MTAQRTLPETQRGPAERLLELVLGGQAHLWHHRPGHELNGVWHPNLVGGARAPLPRGARAVRPGLFVPAAVALYSRLLEVHALNPELMAHLASWSLKESDWRDLKVACAALMLVQSQAGQPVMDGDAVAFHDDDRRAIGEAMVLLWEPRSVRTLTPKAVLRIAELLETPEIAALNRRAGFGDPAGKKPPLGRWKAAATRWLRRREESPALLEGLVKAGFKETLKKLARKCGYKPLTPAFFAALGWKQKQAAAGHRTVGLDNATLVKGSRFDGLSEAEICEAIESQRLSFKEAMGRLPKELGLTPAIMVALLPRLSDRDLRQLTPTLESLGLMAEPEIHARWSKALETATDQRALNIAKNVKSEVLREQLTGAAEHATRNAVREATAEAPVRLLFLIDKSGSMEGAIEQSKEALTRILAGFPLERLHIATFDTVGTVLIPKASTRLAVQHLLARVSASGGTVHAAALHALHAAGVRALEGERLVVIVAGDEAGESGQQLAQAFQRLGYPVAAMAMLVSVSAGAARGNTVRVCAATLGVGFSEVQVASFDDPYQVPRVLRTLLDAPRAAPSPGTVRHGWVERVMATPLLVRPA